MVIIEIIVKLEIAKALNQLKINHFFYTFLFQDILYGELTVAEHLDLIASVRIN